MGAQSFIYEVNATSAKEAYDILYAEACQDVNPNDAYNGSITTCDLSGGRTLSEKYSDKIRKQALDIIDKNGNGEKWRCKYIDCGILEYQVVKPKKHVYTPRKKAVYKQMYCIVTGVEDKIISRHDTKTEADKAAMQYITYHPGSTVYVDKRPVNIVPSGSSKVTVVTAEVKTCKSKPKSSPKVGGIREMRHYILYGWAAI